MPELKPFLFKSIEKSLWRSEWEDWYRSFTIYADAEEITSPVKKRNKLLHLGGTQLQAVAYSLPGAIATLNEKEDDEEIYKVLVVIKANVVVVGEEITMNLAVYVLLGLCSVTSAIVSVISLSNAELPIRDHLPDSETQAESVEGMETQMFDRSQTIVAT
ncbi:hypothetical protein ACLKA7_017708 [Drosophila subpalustris]